MRVKPEEIISVSSFLEIISVSSFFNQKRTDTNNPLGYGHGQAIGARMHGSAPWKTEETIVGLPRLLVLSVFSSSDSPDLVAVTFHLPATSPRPRPPRDSAVPCLDAPHRLAMPSPGRTSTKPAS